MRNYFLASAVCLASVFSTSMANAATAHVTHDLTVKVVEPTPSQVFDPVTLTFITPELRIKTGEKAKLTYSFDTSTYSGGPSCESGHCSQRNVHAATDVRLTFDSGLTQTFGDGSLSLTQEGGPTYANLVWSMASQPPVYLGLPSISSYRYSRVSDPSSFQFGLDNFLMAQGSHKESTSVLSKLPTSLLGVSFQDCKGFNLCNVLLSGTTTVTLDRSAVSAVPIPAPLALLSFAMLGLAQVGRRKAA